MICNLFVSNPSSVYAFRIVVTMAGSELLESESSLTHLLCGTAALLAVSIGASCRPGANRVWKSELAKLLMCPCFKPREESRNLAAFKALHNVLRLMTRVKIQRQGGHLVEAERAIGNDHFVGRIDDLFLLSDDLVLIEYTTTFYPHKAIDAALSAGYLIFEEKLEPLKTFVVTPRERHMISAALVHTTWNAVSNSAVKTMLDADETNSMRLANVDSGLCDFCARRCRDRRFSH